MLVQYSKDKTNRFKECWKGLYYINVANPEITILTTERGNTDYSFLYTVNSNMEYFTREDIEGASRAPDMQHILGWPSNQQLIKALTKDLIINCPVLSDDVRRAFAIYGPASDILKGEMARENLKHVEFKQRITIQAEIMKHYPELPLHMYFCFINGHPYSPQSPDNHR